MFRQALMAILLSAACSAGAAVLKIVPRQGGMLMPMVYYHTDTDRVTVDMSDATNIIAQLTPLLVSHPSGWFDPAAQWFDCLDPSRQGLAFSRRYGFEMDVMSDIPPEDRELWVRKLASAPGLSFYDYNDYVSPLTWNPIWGTAGTSNAAPWNRIMWHFGVTAPPGTNTYAATFEIYVVNTATGMEVPGSGSGAFELNWTCVPDGRPELAITSAAPDSIIVTWPATAAAWSLLSAPNANSPDWIPDTNAVVIFGDRSGVILSNAPPGQFFRLRRNY